MQEAHSSPWGFWGHLEATSQRLQPASPTPAQQGTGTLHGTFPRRSQYNGMVKSTNWNCLLGWVQCWGHQDSSDFGRAGNKGGRSQVAAYFCAELLEALQLAFWQIQERSTGGAVLMEWVLSQLSSAICLAGGGKAMWYLGCQSCCFWYEVGWWF